MKILILTILVLLTINFNVINGKESNLNDNNDKIINKRIKEPQQSVRRSKRIRQKTSEQEKLNQENIEESPKLKNEEILESKKRVKLRSLTQEIEEPLRIGAWNIQRLGQTKMSKPEVVEIIVKVRINTIF